MPLIKRKPAATEGDRRPRLMAELGVEQFCTIPTAILDALMTHHPMEEVRIMACIMRTSFGWDRAYAAHANGAPMSAADIGKAVGIEYKNAHSKLVKLVSEGWIKQDTQGRFSQTFRSFRISCLNRKHHLYGDIFFFSRPDVKESFFQEWESVQSAKELALEQLGKEYQEREEAVKEKFQVKVERKKLDAAPADPNTEVRK